MTERERLRAVRLVELAGVNPRNVAQDGFTVYRNHIVYREFVYPRILTKHSTFVAKTRVVRNPLGSSW